MTKKEKDFPYVTWFENEKILIVNNKREKVYFEFKDIDLLIKRLRRTREAIITNRESSISSSK
jgi:hypothetical protein